MPKAIFISHDGTEKEVEVKSGTSLMQAAISNGVYDIVGDCGGSASCATCHVYVDEDFKDKLEPVQDREEEMLGCTACERASNSRLSCQIVMSDDLDGIVLRIPEEQW